MKRIASAVLLLMLIKGSAAHAQYSYETVLEKTFETSDIFFRPTAVNPYGLGTFGSLSPGLIDDPLLNLQLNPASIAGNPALKGYTYLNFRNSNTIEHNDTYYYPCKTYFMPYPCGSSNGSEAPEPIVAAAFFFQPLSIKKNPLSLGLTYEAIYQDGSYQQVSDNIYRSNPGEDFAGNKTSAISASDITDRYSGRDDMHTDGHLLNIYAGIPVSRHVRLGIKAGLATYLRNGGLGDSYQWDNGMFAVDESRHRMNTARNQKYRHTDIEAGLHLIFDPKTTLGFSAGMINGNVNQDLLTTNSSVYRSGIVNQTVNWSYYSQDGRTDQAWKHSGRYIYGTLSLLHALANDKQFVCYYRSGRQDVGIDLASNIADNSESNYNYKYDTGTSQSQSSSRLNDGRTGSGTHDGWVHQGAAYLQWQTDHKTQVDFGINVQHSNMRTATEEAVLSDRYSEYESKSNSQSYYYINSVVEDKMLRWDFQASVATIQIPLIFHRRFTDKHAFMFGISRRMSRWKLTDATLALFDYRDENRNGDISRKENFGERYTMPDEIESTVTTSILAGYTLTPSEHLKIRLLTTPQFEKTWNGTVLGTFRWWIDFQLSY